MKKTLAVIEKDENGYGVYTPDLKDSVISGSGMSVEAAKADFLTAYKEVLNSYTDSGEAVPEELKDLTFDYKYDVSAFFNQFDCINASKFAAFAGISPSLMRHYKLGDQYISEKQLEKIESAAHELGRRLLAISM
jgi:predicted RNase H-like HicB family nuclease